MGNAILVLFTNQPCISAISILKITQNIQLTVIAVPLQRIIYFIRRHFFPLLISLMIINRYKNIPYESF